MNKQKFINYIHNKYLYTDDNWKTVFKTDSGEVPQGYKKENNLNKAFEAKLKYEFGYKPAALIIKELRIIQKKRKEILGIKPNNNCGYGDEFEIFSMCAIHDISIDDALSKYVVNGSLDGGIDAVYYDDNRCIIYQIKMNSIGNDAIDKMKEKIRFYHDGTLSSTPNCSDLFTFLEGMDKKVFEYINIEYKTLSANPTKDENINSNSIFMSFIKKRTTQYNRSNVLTLKLTDSIGSDNKYTFSKDGKVLFMFAEAKTLIEDIIHCFGEDDFENVFSNNVRGDLGLNVDMERTILDFPNKFCSYNNGISITGSFVAKDNAYRIQVIGPCIVNGQQTIFNLYKSYISRIPIEGITVPLFIKCTEGLDDQARIAKYNNTQKSVSAIDLLSIDQKLRKTQSELITNNIKDCYYLNLVSSGKKKYVSVARTAFGKDRVIKITDFIKLYSVINSPSELGPWKNNFNAQVALNYGEGFPECDYTKAKFICECITNSKPLISSNKAKYAIADLPIQYLLSLGATIEEAKSIIDKTITDNPSMKPADIFKSKAAFQKIKKFIPKKYLKE